jgi:hypothetical protein
MGRRARVDDTRVVRNRVRAQKIAGGGQMKDSKDSGCVDLTVSSLAARDSYGVATMLAGCDE